MADSKFQRRYTTDELLDHLREHATDGVAPTVAELNTEIDGPTGTTYYRYWDSYNTAVKEAGLSVNSTDSSVYQHSHDELIEWLVVWYLEMGVAPRVSDFATESPTPAPRTYANQFDETFAELRDRVLGERFEDYEPPK